jgi:coenzyme F420-0:L-glutamate ligase / coenzyme F420-1:gamma-L-glutamate ligase
MRAVDCEVVDRILTTAISAPSAHNRQPWRFVVLTGHRDKLALANAMASRLREDRLKDGDLLSVVEADALRSKERITSAPVVILVFMTMEEMDRYPDARRQEAERAMAVQGTAMAMQNLLLAAHAEGLGACLMCAPLFCPDVITKVLDTPARWSPQALITLGVADQAREKKPRKPLSEVAHRRPAQS